MPVTGLNHVGISTPDFARCLDFYARAFGFTEVVSYAWEAGNPAADAGLGVVGSAADLAVMHAGTTYLELFHFRSPTPRPAERGQDLRRAGITHIGIECADVDLTQARALAAGATVFEERDDFVGKAVRLIRDPDGNVIELGAPTGQSHDRDVRGIGHVAIASADPEALVPFYVAAGLRVSADDSYPQSRCITLDVGNACVELIQDTEVGVLGRAEGSRIIDHGFNHICFDVEGIGVTYDTLTPLGMTCFANWGTMPGGATNLGYAVDPQGTTVEWLEHLAPTSTLWPGNLSG